MGDPIITLTLTLTLTPLQALTPTPTHFFIGQVSKSFYLHFYTILNKNILTKKYFLMGDPINHNTNPNPNPNPNPNSSSASDSDSESFFIGQVSKKF